MGLVLISRFREARIPCLSRRMHVGRSTEHQEGFLITKTGESVGFLHDGRAAFHLQAGVWVLGVGRTYAANNQGLSDDKLG